MGTITHAKVSAIPDDPAAIAAGEVVPTDWNAGHSFSLDKNDVGLGNVDNTSDADKPISTATQAALDTKAPLADPDFTGQLTVTQTTANTTAVVIDGPPQTGVSSAAPLHILTEWNTSDYGRGILLDITNTASSGQSYLIDAKIDGTSEFTVRRTGGLIDFAAPNGPISYFASGRLAFGPGNSTKWSFETNGSLEGWGYGDCVLLNAGYSTKGSYTGSNALPVAGFGAVWNTSGVINLIEGDVTNTASGAGSKLLNLKVGGSSVFSVGLAGDVTASNLRYKLTANTTYNVPSTYATLDAALVAAAQVDFNGFRLTIQLAAGTYSPAASFFAIPVTVGQATVRDLLILGDAATPANVTLNKSGSFSGIVKCGAGGRCRIQGVTFTGNGNTFGIHALDGGNVEILNVDFSTGFFYHRFTESGGVISSQGAYTVSASANAHAAAANGGYSFDVGSTITISGTPAWTSGYANADALSFMLFNSGAGTNFSGSATGPRYSSTFNSVILSGGGGANFLPGNSAGSTGTGGLYS